MNPQSTIRRLAHRIALGLAASVACLAYLANATDIRWSSADTFEHSATLAPGKTEEVCGSIEPRLPVEWRFSADGPLTFDIHRHSGSEVIYATKSYLTREQKGKHSPTFNFEWCWTWTNDSPEAVTVRVNLKR
jgi:hypothetical protein